MAVQRRNRQETDKEARQRLTEALEAIFNVPWTSSGRGRISTEEQYARALARIDAIVREALDK